MPGEDLRKGEGAAGRYGWRYLRWHGEEGRVLAPRVAEGWVTDIAFFWAVALAWFGCSGFARCDISDRVVETVDGGLTQMQRRLHTPPVPER